jgi:ABC-type dipeptide/oligopeptide/nickel transport system permease subunit
MKKRKTDPVKTVLIISVGFTFVYLLSHQNWAIYVAVIVGLVGILSGYLSRKIDFLWMKLAWILSLIIPNILLGIVFYLVLFPISVVSKIFGPSNPLALKNTTDSLYKNCNKQFDKASFERLW